MTTPKHDLQLAIGRERAALHKAISEARDQRDRLQEQVDELTYERTSRAEHETEDAIRALPDSTDPDLDDPPAPF